MARSGEAAPELLRVEDVTAGYGESVVLRNVDLVVEPGKVVALLGPNGAGKTTLLRVVSGLVHARSGQVVFDGEPVTHMRPEGIARLGLCHVPEGRGVFPSLSVQENLLLQARRGEEKQASERATAVFPELGRRMKQIAGSMSGGEQQMLALARAYLANPKLVAVDEASLGLAPIVVDRIFDTLSRLAQTGVSLLVVEQYVSRALELADTAYLMDRGRVVYSGPAAALDEREIAERYLGVD
jgi:branched-chain amino acid transport system ATP-binding protein